MTKKKTSNLIWRNVLLIAVLIVSVGPILLLFMNAFKTSADFLADPFGLPSKLRFDNFVRAWRIGGYSRAYLNSILCGISTIATVSVFAGACAFALAKMKFKGSNMIMVYLLLAMTIPVGLFLVPLFFIWQKLHIMNSLFGLIIIYAGVNIPFNTFFLRAFFIGIPNELLESAKIDGCDDFSTFFKMILPIAKPAFFTVSLLIMLSTWNEFFFANAFIQTDALRTVSTRYLAFTGQFSAQWNMIFAAGAVAIFPIMVFYLLFQKNFIEGLTSGSVKG